MKALEKKQIAKMSFMMKHNNMFAEKIINFAKELGFDLIGFTPVEIEPKYIKAFKKWLKNGNEAEMEYMRDISSRKNLRKLLPEAESVIVLGVNYYQKQPKLKKGHGRIARYAYGKDYHKIIGKKLKELEKFIQNLKIPDKKLSTSDILTIKTSHPPTNPSLIVTKSYVDTGHILERAYAVQAGLGFIGKNSCLITREFGSWVFLAEIIINRHVAKRSAPIVSNILRQQNSQLSPCGLCTRCMDSCPIQAIIAPGVIDARKCISYNTIENKGKIHSKISAQIKKTKRIFGCDICQEVCPHNIAKQKSITSQSPLSTTPIAGDQISIKKILSHKTDQHFLETFAGSPLMRAKRKGLQRNAKILL